MYKELIISIIIIIGIFSFDYVLQKNTTETIDTTTENLSFLKQEIKENKYDSKQIEEKTNNIYNEWNENHQKLVFYIEHDELEKVEIDFAAFKSLIESKEYNFAISELEKVTFALEHIKDKYLFQLENIF